MILDDFKDCDCSDCVFKLLDQFLSDEIQDEDVLKRCKYYLQECNKCEMYVQDKEKRLEPF